MRRPLHYPEQRVDVLDVFQKTGLADWEDAGLLAQVLAASQQEYLDNLKKSREADNQESVDPPPSQVPSDQGQGTSALPSDVASDEHRCAAAASGTNNS